MSAERKLRAFQRMAWVTLVAILFLIWVGAMVRATDSGMGCPDWPTCFGRWVPPTDVSQLPADYKVIYADHGYADNDFDPRKTWIEYTNRLTGTSIGLLIFITLILAWRIRAEHKRVLKMTFLTFLAVGLNGWLGSIVVKSNLHPAVITTHMLLSFAAIGCLIAAIAAAMKSKQTYFSNTALKPLLVIAVVITVIQVTLGAQVREGVDQIAALADDFYAREGWVEQLGGVFVWHRLFAMVVLIVNALLVWRLLQQPTVHRFQHRIAWLICFILLLIITVGLVMMVFSIPPLAQPVHLFLVVCLFSVQVFTFYLQPVAD